MARAASRAGARGVSSPTRALARPLARVGDPYVTLAGNIIQPERIPVDVEEDQPQLTEKSFKPSQRRALKELPAAVNILNAVACVFLYTVLGIGDREIAAALKTTLADVKQIREHPAYTECFNSIVSEFISANSDLIHSRIAAYSHDALSRIADIALNGKQEGNVLRASTDIMDRGGFTKKDLGKSGSGMDELRIIVTKGDADVQVDVRRAT